MNMFMVFLLLAILITPVMAEQRLFKDGVEIVSICIVMPVGRVLLISRDNFMGAVKFLQNEERPDGTYSKYDYFEYEKSGFKKVREGEVLLKKPSSGKGIFFHHGPNEMVGPPLKLRNFSLFTHAAGTDHATVYFSNARDKPDLKVRMAPTPWKDISEVNLTDSGIRWFACDDKESRKVIPIDKIWD
jgi:hypothetical protein